ncbi:MAG: hypothetical protein HN350_11725 [Phycisphaerales bacterium]|jgi:hypothetical protein|nr:hypothetical protein [Phycisphaerales bacterium]
MMASGIPTASELGGRVNPAVKQANKQITDQRSSELHLPKPAAFEDYAALTLTLTQKEFATTVHWHKNSSQKR